MESKTTERLRSESDVMCPLHPSYRIQAVNMSVELGQNLFCSLCMLQQKDFSILSNLKTFPEVLATATKVYKKNKRSREENEKPKEYDGILTRQDEIVDILTKHIEGEKEKAVVFFDNMEQEVRRVIAEKKEKCLKELSFQVETLISHLFAFESQLKRAYPAKEDFEVCFPTQEDLEERFQAINDFKELKQFAGELKNEILKSQKKVIDGLMDVKEYPKMFYKRLGKTIEKRPYFSLDEQLKNRFVDQISEFMERNITLEDPVKEVWQPRIEQSMILTKRHLYQLQKWLPPNHPFNPVRIYQSPQDGLGARSFHQYCDGKKNTVSIFECCDHLSNEFILGGYLDEPWHSRGTYIKSDKAFIFSLTSNIKCPVVSSQHAALGQFNLGPTFGIGYDLHTAVEMKGSVTPYSYSGSATLIPAKKDPMNKTDYFYVKAVEVFTLD